MRSAAARALELAPDDPAGHVLLASALSEEGGNLAALEGELLPMGLAAAQSPTRRELLELAWRQLRVSDRLKHELPGDELIAERAQVLSDLAAFQTDDPLEQERRNLLYLSLFRLEDGTPGAGAELPLVDEELSRGDPPALAALIPVLEGPGDEDRRALLIDQLLRSDPTSPRYPLYLVYAAQHEAHPREALTQLIASGLDPRYRDDAELLVAGHLLEEGWDIPEDGWWGLERLIYSRRVRNTTVPATRLLAGLDVAEFHPEDALRLIEQAEALDPYAVVTLGPLESRARAQEHDWNGAIVALRSSLRLGGTDFDRWWLLAEAYRRSGRSDEALRLFRFYLVQVDARASGSLPVGPPVDPGRQLAAHGKVWSRYALLEPSFVARSALRQLLELLAATAAAVLAAARIERARRFLLPGLLAAEVVLVSGWVAMRCAPPGVALFGGSLDWLWLAVAAGRALVLVGGGLFLSASLSLPRRSRLPWPGVLVAVGAAAGVGFLVGFPRRPELLPDDLSLVTRLGELGLGPETLREAPILLVAIIRSEASARLVWPALLLAAAGGRRAGRPSTLPLLTALLGTAALTSSATLGTGGPLGFGGAFAAALVLTFLRFRFGSLLPFLLHAGFAAGALATVTGP